MSHFADGCFCWHCVSWQLLFVCVLLTGQRLRLLRRERERQSPRRTPGAPPKYKRRRIETSTDTAVFGEVEHDRDHSFTDEEYDEIDLARESLEADRLDPLDAQALGPHDRDYDLGHEEIHLNLDAADETPHKS